MSKLRPAIWRWVEVDELEREWWMEMESQVEVEDGGVVFLFSSQITKEGKR